LVERIRFLHITHWIMFRPVNFVASAIHFPQRQVLSEHLEGQFGLPAGWIAEHTGVRCRYYADLPEETNVRLAGAVARKVLKAADLQFREVDMLINASATYEQPLPCTAALIQRELGEASSGVPCFDINATCLSFPMALELASAWLTVQGRGRVLIVSAEVASIGLNWDEPETAAMFGDGAAAFILEHAGDRNSGLLASSFETFSEGVVFCEVKGGGSALPPWDYKEELRAKYRFAMNGPALHRIALKRFPGLVERVLADANINLAEVDYLVPHQAGLLPMRLIARRLGLPEERMMVTLPEHGNVIAAGLPICFHLGRERKILRPGQLILLAGTAAGYSQGAMLFRL
jgi:3-oxoacyl-[acyl-carrier-protein] synthase III